MEAVVDAAPGKCGRRLLVGERPGVRLKGRWDDVVVGVGVGRG